MKYIKTFEDVTPKLELGTYVICQEESNNVEYEKFLRNNIGVIYGYFDGETKDRFPYMVQYENIPENIEDFFNDYKEKFPNCRAMTEQEIIYDSKNKKDLVPYLVSNKFNI